MASRRLFREVSPIPKRLIDTLREGLAPDVIRRQGARGELPVPPAEAIEILAFLAVTADPETSRQALTTLRACNGADLERVLSDPSTPAEVVDVALRHLVETQEGLAEALARNPAFASDEVAGLWEAVVSENQPKATDAPDEKRETLLQKIARMKPAQRIKLALLGSAEERMVLIRDPNRAVRRSVLESPKLSDSEVEAFTAMKNTKEEVLRIIAQKRNLLKNATVIRNLVTNPRSPVDVSLPLIKHLRDRELKLLTTDKNIPEAVRASAVRLYLKRTQR